MYITGSKKVQQKLWEKATEVIKHANKNDIGKKELVKILLEIGANKVFVGIILTILLAISVIWNILQFIAK